MAYSNWGAFVYRADKRRRDCEDVPVFGDRSSEVAAPSGARIWVNLLKHKPGEQLPWQRAHHAVLGDGPVRLCGYKSYPEVWVLRDETPEKVEIDWEPWGRKGYEPYVRAGEIDGFKWQAEYGQDPEHVGLILIEPDGTPWRAKAGYCIGAGHEDDPDPDDAPGECP